MTAEFDYIVVGSGAGGGPLACNLALAREGFRVALLEAGEDFHTDPGSPSDYSSAVPALHPYASEDEKHSWAFFVEHYAAPAQQQKDWKRRPNGVFYPRAGALGGCTSIHALISMYPHNADWDNLKRLTGDDSWSAEKMRGYFECLEEWRDAPAHPAGQTRDPVARRGLAGWLPISSTDPALLLQDDQLLQIFFLAFLVGTIAARTPQHLTALLDAKGAGERDKAQAALLGAIDDLVKAAGQLRQRGDALEELLGRVSKVVAELKGKKVAPLQLLAQAAGDFHLLSLFRLVRGRLDPNRWFPRDADRVGAHSVPISTLHGVRSAVRERILEARGFYPERLILISNALATRVLIEKGQAVGVRYVQGEAGKPLYRAARLADQGSRLPPEQEVRLRPGGEVILACGAFNTPQLLMLSGVGPAKHLKAQGIPVVCDLPGVGCNLHDRYEVSIVSEMPTDFRLLEGAKFAPPPALHPEDEPMREWVNHRGIYTTNGVLLCVLARSRSAVAGVPDLCLFGTPGNFRGYYPGYAADVQSEAAGNRRLPNHRRFTWAILKGQTRNRAGTVRLQSKDPRQTPAIQFRYFSEGSPGWEKDLDGLVEGVQLADKIMKAAGLKVKQLYPTCDLSNARAVKEFIQNDAWGHHACGTCKIGKDRAAVLDGDFRVRGVKQLRVVDASVFPDIPGFFLAVPVYMISEKASKVILASRRRAPAADWPAVVK
jgi:choline dehydrogenase